MMTPTFIKTFKEQLKYEPELQHAERLPRVRRVLLVGMGGSHLSADLLRTLHPQVHLSVHSDYDLPHAVRAHKKDVLVVVQSHSGNTEEALSAFRMAHQEKLPLAVIAGGGTLLEMAKEQKVPHIQIPQEGQENIEKQKKIEPRDALGYGLVALAALLGEEKILSQLRALAESFNPNAREKEGQEFAALFLDRTPIIYSSHALVPLAYIWKISMNETAKTPTYTNIFPELNHNEIESFANTARAEAMSKNFCFLFLRDPADDLRVQKRMDILEEMLAKKGFLVRRAASLGESAEEKMYSQIALAKWCAHHLAALYGVDPNETRFIESFKAKL